MRTLVWFRQKDLRIADHGPLNDAAKKGEAICVFVLSPEVISPQRAHESPHATQFLLESIEDLSGRLERRGGALVLISGRDSEVLPRVAREWHVDRVVAERWTEPSGRAREQQIRDALSVPFETWDDETLATPGSLRSLAGTPYSVFTAFARAHRASVTIDRPSPVPIAIDSPALVREQSARLPTLAELGIGRNPKLLAGGERAAKQRLARFLESFAARYHEERDRMDLATTSRLSQDLRFGTLSARTIWTLAEKHLERHHPTAWKSFSNELLWREFAHAVLWDNPMLLERPRRREFESFPWRQDTEGWEAWCQGRTGFPIVDAAARQLLQEGFVHNRARMIAASFLVKDLLIDYRSGEAHYLRYLTDGDLAQNNAGWQWSAGCGFDAQPYFRVFNPMEQGKKFDPTGDYVKKWLPELAKLPKEFVHAPWTAPPLQLHNANVVLGKTYPHPIVDHAVARKRFLVLAESLTGR